MTYEQQIRFNRNLAEQINFKQNRNNVSKINFKNNERDSYNTRQVIYTQPPMYDRNATLIAQHDKEQKRNKIIRTAITGIGALASLTMLAYFGKLMYRDHKIEKQAKQAEQMLENLNNDIKTSSFEEVLKNCDNPQIKRSLAEEYQKGITSMSNKKIHGLEQLASLTASKPQIIDIENAKKILDKRVMGLDTVKKQVIEFLEYRNYCIRIGKTLDKPLVISLDGPAGTCKTTIASAIAEATGMPYKEISAAGASGKAKIMGHEPVYQGASWGEFADAQIEHGRSDIVYTLDELEKAAKNQNEGLFEDQLLSALDDRHKIHDDFLGVDISTKDSIIILTTNEFEKLSEPLKDRISYKFKLEGFDADLKAKIAKFKMNIALEKHQLKDKIQIDDDVYAKIAELTSDQGGREVSENVSKIIVKLTSAIERKNTINKLDKNITEQWLKAKVE